LSSIGVVAAVLVPETKLPKTVKLLKGLTANDLKGLPLTEK
jgi:hypothetical protein